LSYGEFFDEVIELYRKHFGLLVGTLGAPMALCCSLLWIYGIIVQVTTHHAAGKIPFFHLFYAPLWMIMVAATAYATSRVYLGKPTTIAESYKSVLSRWLPLTLTAVLFYIPVVIGLFAFLIPGIALFMFFIFAN
jgi:hypothetical protein